MDTSTAPLNSAIAVLNQDYIVLRDTLRRVKGCNFMTPYFMGVWRVSTTPYCIEVSQGTYMDGSTMYGLTAFVSATGKILPGIGKASDAENLQERLQSVVDSLLTLHQSTKEETPNAE